MLVDPVRPGAAEAVRGLRRLGLMPVLLTGGDARAAHVLAAALGIDDVLAEVPREDGAAAVAGQRGQGRTVAVLGGPANAAALDAADVALVHPGGSVGPAGGPRLPDGAAHGR